MQFFVPFLEALAIALVSFLFLVGMRRFALRLLKKIPDTDFRSFKAIAEQLLGSTHILFLVAFSLFLGTLWIDLGEDFDIYIRKVAFIALIVLAGLWSNVGINHAIDFTSARYQHKKGMSTAIFSILRTVSKMLVGALLFLFILDNLNFEVSTLLAGLGIGGIAIALAVQNILQDLFASLSIIIDKPFLIGDFIIVDGFMGTVEYIGIKTTRVRSLGGEQIIFSNADLLKCRLRNYKRMNERRVVFAVKVTYETDLDKVKSIPIRLKEIVTNLKNTRFDRAHFKEFGSYSLDFEVVYYVLSSDYAVYMDIQQKINEEIIENFQAEQIELAYPTTKSIRIEPKIVRSEKTKDFS